jgi:hypothetical protein
VEKGPYDGVFPQLFVDFLRAESRTGGDVLQFSRWVGESDALLGIDHEANIGIGIFDKNTSY